MTPFVGAMRAALGEVLARELAPPGATLRWRELGGGERGAGAVGVGGAGAGAGTRAAGAPRLASLLVEWRRGEVTVQATLTTAGEAPAKAPRRGPLGLGLRLPPGEGRQDPGWRRLAAELLGAFDRADAAAILAAVDALRPYVDVADEHLRHLARSTRGAAGMLRLGFRCNQDCDFCWQDRRWPGPPEALYTTWIDEFAAAGAVSLAISGGEPTLHRGLGALVARAAGHGLEVHVQTNAVALREPARVEALRAAGLHGLLVSLHAAEAALSDRMTRAPGTWGHTVRGVENALAAGLAVGLNTVVDRRNAAQLPALADLVLARFVAPFPANPVRVVNLSHPSPYEDRAAFEEAALPLDELAGPLGEAVRRLEGAGLVVHAGGTCGFPLCVLPAGSRVREGLAAELADEHAAAARVEAPVCAGCARRARCAGVRPEYLARFGERGLAAIVV